MHPIISGWISRWLKGIGVKGSEFKFESYEAPVKLADVRSMRKTNDLTFRKVRIFFKASAFPAGSVFMVKVQKAMWGFC